MTSRYIISGGPGSGKSTLTEGLKAKGYSCSAEVSRRMIIQEVAMGSDCLPWKDINCFSSKVLKEMSSEWHSVPNDKLTFFDRGIPDIIAYLKLAKLTVPDEFTEALASHPYEKKVFILPPWQDIYVNDAERWQDFKEAEATGQMIQETYAAFGFEIIEVPKITVKSRITFILNLVS